MDVLEKKVDIVETSVCDSTVDDCVEKINDNVELIGDEQITNNINEEILNIEEISEEVQSIPGLTAHLFEFEKTSPFQNFYLNHETHNWVCPANVKKFLASNAVKKFQEEYKTTIITNLNQIPSIAENVDFIIVNFAILPAHFTRNMPVFKLDQIINNKEQARDLLKIKGDTQEMLPLNDVKFLFVSQKNIFEIYGTINKSLGKLEIRQRVADNLSDLFNVIDINKIDSPIETSSLMKINKPSLETYLNDLIAVCDLSEKEYKNRLVNIFSGDGHYVYNKPTQKPRKRKHNDDETEDVNEIALSMENEEKIKIDTSMIFDEFSNMTKISPRINFQQLVHGEHKLDELVNELTKFIVIAFKITKVYYGIMSIQYLLDEILPSLNLELPKQIKSWSLCEMFFSKQQECHLFSTTKIKQIIEKNCD